MNFFLLKTFFPLLNFSKFKHYVKFNYSLLILKKKLYQNNHHTITFRANALYIISNISMHFIWIFLDTLISWNSYFCHNRIHIIKRYVRKMVMEDSNEKKSLMYIVLMSKYEKLNNKINRKGRFYLKWWKDLQKL